MKHILSIFLGAAFLITGCTQSKPTGFTIKGTTDSKSDSIYVYTGLENLVASAPIVNGTFELKGSVTEPQNAGLAVHGEEAGKKYKAGMLILENADYTYSRNGYYTKIKGGKLHDRVLGFESSDEYMKALSDYDAAVEKPYAADSTKKGYDDLTQEEKDLIEKTRQIAMDIENRALDKVIDDPKAPVLAKVFALGRTQCWEKYPSAKRIEMFDAYEKELEHPSVELTRSRDEFKAFIEDEKKAAAFAPGKMFKDIEVNDAKGNTIKLSEVVAKNKFTMLEFWASWCSPCRGEIPNLKKAYEKYKGKGLEIYSVSIDEEQADWLKALEEENTTWIQVIDDKKAANDYAIQGVPASFLIGQDGKIVEVGENLRGKELDKTLSKHIK